GALGPEPSRPDRSGRPDRPGRDGSDADSRDGKNLRGRRPLGSALRRRRAGGGEGRDRRRPGLVGYRAPEDLTGPWERGGLARRFEKGAFQMTAFPLA